MSGLAAKRGGESVGVFAGSYEGSSGHVTYLMGLLQSHWGTAGKNRHGRLGMRGASQSTITMYFGKLGRQDSSLMWQSQQ